MGLVAELLAFRTCEEIREANVLGSKRVTKTTATSLAALALLGLAACGHSTEDRALSGAGIGAATGAVGSALTGGSPVGGAVLGGAAGAAVGAITDEEDIDLGDPLWDRHHHHHR